MESMEELKERLEKERGRTDKFRERKKLKGEIRALKKERYDGDLLSSIGKGIKGAGASLKTVGKVFAGMGDGANKYYGTAPLTRSEMVGRPIGKKRKPKKRKQKRKKTKKKKLI